MSSSRRVAILVGVNAYPDSPLDYSVNDVEELQELLKFPEYGFTVTPIIDAEATRRNVKTALEAAIESAPDFLIFYFSGHGTATDLGSYLDTVDADEPDEGISLDYLRRLAEVRLKGGSLLYILDCCHAGGASVPGAGRITAAIRGDDIARELSAMGGDGRAVLGSCRADEFSRERTSLRHSLFTSHLLDGLTGAAANTAGEVTVSSIYDYISLKFANESLQSPVFRGDLAGRLVIGNGFPASIRIVVDEEEFSTVEATARRHLDGYSQDLTALRVNLEYWRHEGYKQACSSLEPIAQWFAKQPAKSPGLEKRASFQALLSELHDRQRELAGLSQGT